MRNGLTDDKSRFRPTLALAAAVVLTGVAAGLGGMLLGMLLHIVQHLAYHYSTGEVISHESFLQGVEAAPPLRRLLALVLCGLVAGAGWWLVYRYGRPLVSVKQAVKDPASKMPAATTLAHAILQIITVGLGSPLGREVAPREVGALAASRLSELLRLPPEQHRLIVACGAGAGLAAVYNVPLGAALFVLEVLLGSFAWPAAAIALATCCIGAVVAWIGLGNETQYTVPAMSISASLILWALVTGPVFGWAAHLFVRLTTAARRRAARGWQLPVATLLNFTLIGCLAIYLPALLGNGKGPAQLGFNSELTIGLATTLLVLKVAITSSTLRAGAEGGLLTPGIAIGATLAIVLGGLWNLIWPDAPSGAYAIIGAAAFLASSMSMPLTAIVLITEFTRVDQGFLVPIILAVAGSVTTNHFFAARAASTNARVAAPTPARLERGMTMTQRDLTGIHRYDAPAGGWGALKATAQAVADQMRIAEAPLLLLRTNKPDGFDCPGCAWPDKAHTSTFQFCENGAKAVTWEATKKRVTPEFFAAHTVTELQTWSDHDLEDAGRLTHPLAYDAASDTYQVIEWDAAFARIGSTLAALPDPHAVEFYTSGRASNEAAFLFSLYAREYGTNNFPDCSNMCHEATSVGLPHAIGIGKGTVSLDDFDACDLIISMGHNPGTNHPRMMGTLHECARRGVPIIVFNPLRERALERFADPQNPVEMGTLGSTPIASTYYQVKVGGDAAALKGIMKALLAAADSDPAVLDHDFIATHTHGFEAFAQDLAATPWQAIEAASGLTRADLENVAAAYAKSNAAIVTYGMGITQHARGTSNVQQIAALLLLRGNFGKPGAGICPLRGHSNVQGNRTVGITEKIDPVMFDNIEKTFGFRPPERHGHDAVDAMKAMVRGDSKVLICLGGNLAVALSDTEQCAEGMRRLDLAVHLNTKLNRSHLLIGRNSIILPVLGRTEADVQASGAQSVTVEDSMSMVHASRGKLAPASEHLRSEPAIIAGMAQATLPHSRVPWQHLVEDYGRIRDLIEKVYPDFQGYNERILKPGGFRLSLPPTERIWKTPSGKAEFLPFEGLQEDPAVATEGVLKLTTLRSHDQYNTTIYGLDDRYRGVFGRRDVLFMNASDLEHHGIEHGERVEITTGLPGETHRRLQLTAIAYDIAAGSVGAYYPESNNLCPLDYQDKQSGTPSYKSIPVTIKKAA